jgi:lipoate-protein ligase B
LQLGLIEYGPAWEFQRYLAGARAAGKIPDTLILLQHPHTYTLGRSAVVGHLLMNEQERKEKGISLYHVDRGGDITYHGPGQLIGYPILCLGTPGMKGRLPAMDYVGYLRSIEEVLIQVCAEWEISAQRSQGYTGVWVNDGKQADANKPRKIAAIGVKVDGRGVSQHGFALNVDPDQSYFDGIVPCGLHDRGVTSMAQEMGRTILPVAAAPSVARRFGHVFGIDWQPISLEELAAVPGCEFEPCRLKA